MTLFELDPPAADVAEETAEYNDDPVVLEFIGLPHPQGEASADRGDNDGSEYTSAAVVGRKACGNADNSWQRVHYEVK